MRTVVGLHTTWLVNSATHSWGTRRFVTKDLSTNSWWVAILTFGEGWHNNHHAHPVSARHGLRWYEIDMNWYGIWMLKKLGLARHVYRVKLDDLNKGEANAPSSDFYSRVSFGLAPNLCHSEKRSGEGIWVFAGNAKDPDSSLRIAVPWNPIAG